METPDAFVMRRYENVLVVRWTAPSSAEQSDRFMRALRAARAETPAPLIGVCVFGEDIAPPNAALQRHLLTYRDEFFASLQSIHFVFERSPDAPVRLGFQVARVFAWVINAFPLLRTTTSESLTQALAEARVPPTLAARDIVARARRDGLVRATRGPDART